ncbi:MAG: lysophospholipid acyltransferase family protein, partial [Acidobacteriota bacterium]
MLYWISAFARVTAILAATFSGWFALLLGHGLRGVAPRLALDIRNAAFRLWSRLLLKAFRVRVEVEGEPPPAGSFLVSNHVSYLDIMVLASGYDAGFVAKADIRNWPALGTIFAAGDTLYLDRGRKRDLVRIMGQMDSTREKGLGLIVFPEGTSTRG